MFKRHRPVFLSSNENDLTILTPRNDIAQASALTEKISDAAVIADKGYDSQGFIDIPKQKHAPLSFPKKKS